MGFHFSQVDPVLLFISSGVSRVPDVLRGEIAKLLYNSKNSNLVLTLKKVFCHFVLVLDNVLIDTTVRLYILFIIYRK